MGSIVRAGAELRWAARGKWATPDLAPSQLALSLKLHSPSKAPGKDWTEPALSIIWGDVEFTPEGCLGHKNLLCQSCWLNPMPVTDSLPMSTDTVSEQTSVGNHLFKEWWREKEK